MEALDAEILNVLSCDISARPSNGPTLDDFLSGVKTSDRKTSSLEVTFEPSLASTLLAFAEAESVCCPEIGWHVSEVPNLTLTISAEPEHLDILSELFSSPEEPA
jgi:hypothetical protein